MVEVVAVLGRSRLQYMAEAANMVEMVPDSELGLEFLVPLSRRSNFHSKRS